MLCKGGGKVIAAARLNVTAGAISSVSGFRMGPMENVTALLGGGERNVASANIT